MKESCETVRAANPRVAAAVDGEGIARVAAEVYRKVASEGDQETRELFEPAIPAWDHLAAGNKHTKETFDAIMAVDRACTDVRQG